MLSAVSVLVQEQRQFFHTGYIVHKTEMVMMVINKG